MSDRSFSTSDLSRKSGDIIAEALRRPVMITQRSKPRLVLMNVEDYEVLRSRADTRAARRIEDMSDEMLERVEAAIEDYATDEQT